MRLSYRILVCGIAARLLSPAEAVAQERRHADRPSIGVALSGGAALGLAHIGVTAFALNHAGTCFGRKMDYFDQFIAGDQGNMPAFRYQEFHANTLVTAGSGLILHPRTIPHVSSHPGLAFWYEAGRFDLGSQGWRTHQSTSIATFFPTQVGATGLELSFDENGKARFRLMLGSF